jgi:hypothetical protein
MVRANEKQPCVALGLLIHQVSQSGGFLLKVFFDVALAKETGGFGSSPESL